MTTAPALDLDDIQGNLLHGYSSDAAAYLFLTVHDAEATKAWLADTVPRVTTAEHPPTGLTLNIAVTHPGLAALGASEICLASFPRAFREGMAERAHLLGDRGASAPSTWEPPFDDPSGLHLMVVVTGDADSVDDQVSELRQGWWQAGLTEPAKTEPLVGHHLPGRREHFGYTDGMSQPGVIGVHHEGGQGEGVRDGDTWRPLMPGEFVLGLPDEDDSPPPMPHPAELGRHGTYLVLRKLNQDVATFRSRLEATAEALGIDPHLVAARLMGRWRDGTPITLRPGGEDPELAGDKQANNRFTFEADPSGYRCPVGAHIRRANPRGSLGFAGTLERRHRIIRRGIPYGDPLPEGEPDDGEQRGLVFVCYQADIERQFEFVQSAWLNDGNVFALGADRDPFLGDPSGGTGRMRFEGHPPLFVDGFQDTVRVRGGAYFFVPSVTALRHLSRLPGSGGD